jgi:glutamine amidotransferase
MIAIVDYGVGNLFSLRSSFKYIGQDAEVTGDPQKIRNSDKVLLPGVGAFEDAAKKLRESGLDTVVCAEAQKGKPLLGVCLGMQLLFDKSFEYGEHEGLGLICGSVVSMEPVVPKGYKIPQIGWNDLIFPKDKPVNPLFKYIKEGDHVYFVHSYYRGMRRRRHRPDGIGRAAHGRRRRPKRFRYAVPPRKKRRRGP